MQNIKETWSEYCTRREKEKAAEAAEAAKASKLEKDLALAYGSCAECIIRAINVVKEMREKGYRF